MVQQDIENPDLARTILDDESDTVAPSGPQTRIHTPGPQQPLVRWLRLGDSGAGNYGLVQKVINVDSGRVMAVKIMKPSKDEQTWIRSVKREIEALSRLTHPNIVEYIAWQGLSSRIEIFMALKEGSLQQLVRQDGEWRSIAKTVLNHILLALNFIAEHGIIHRDVKPSNILYSSLLDGKYLFQLGDFGLCHSAMDAHTTVGTLMYMAPELFRKGEQTAKIDVWALYVSILWVLDVDGFRQFTTGPFNFEATINGILETTKYPQVSSIREMAIFDPERRASASDMLVKLFGGAPDQASVASVDPTPHEDGPVEAGPSNPSPAVQTNEERPGSSGRKGKHRITNGARKRIGKKYNRRDSQARASGRPNYT